MPEDQANKALEVWAELANTITQVEDRCKKRCEGLDRRLTEIGEEVERLSKAIESLNKRLEK